MSRCFILLALLLAGAQAQAQQGPIVPGYDKMVGLEPMLGAVNNPCDGPRLIAASDPFSFLYRESEGSSTRAELRLRGALGLCMRNFVVSVYGQYSDVTRGTKLVPGYGPDGTEMGPWPESQDMYLTLQMGPRFILPSRGQGDPKALFHHELLILARGQIYEERDFKVGCENGQCPWVMSLMPLYRMGLGIFRLSAGASIDYSQLVTDWWERNPSHEEDGFGSRRFSLSGLIRGGVRFGQEEDLAVLDLFGQAAITMPLISDAGQPGRAYGVGAELGVPLIRRDEDSGVEVMLKGRIDYTQHYVADADCNAPERAAAPCYFKGLTIGPLLFVGFGEKKGKKPGYALNEDERKEEAAAKAENPPPAAAIPLPPEPQPASPPKLPEVKSPDPAPILPAPEPPAPVEIEPVKPKECLGLYDSSDDTIRTVMAPDSGCVGQRQTLRREPMDDKSVPLRVLVCRANRGGITAITDMQGKTSTCVGILQKWNMVRSR